MAEALGLEVGTNYSFMRLFQMRKQDIKTAHLQLEKGTLRFVSDLTLELGITKVLRLTRVRANSIISISRGS